MDRSPSVYNYTNMYEYSQLCSWTIIIFSRFMNKKFPNYELGLDLRTICNYKLHMQNSPFYIKLLLFDICKVSTFYQMNEFQSCMYVVYVHNYMMTHVHIYN